MNKISLKLLNILKILFELDLLQVNVICFKIRFCCTCTGWTAVL